jgi:hypothetical protein
MLHSSQWAKYPPTQSPSSQARVSETLEEMKPLFSTRYVTPCVKTATCAYYLQNIYDTLLLQCPYSPENLHCAGLLNWWFWVWVEWEASPGNNRASREKFTVTVLESHFGGNEQILELLIASVAGAVLSLMDTPENCYTWTKTTNHGKEEAKHCNVPDRVDVYFQGGDY